MQEIVHPRSSLICMHALESLQHAAYTDSLVDFLHYSLETLTGQASISHAAGQMQHRQLKVFPEPGSERRRHAALAGSFLGAADVTGG